MKVNALSFIFTYLLVGSMLSGCANASGLARMADRTSSGGTDTSIATPIATPQPVGSARANSTVENQPELADLEVGFTEEGYPYRGDPNAPITLFEYSDFLCPFCGQHFEQTMPLLIDQYIRTGKLKYVFRDYPIAELHPTARLGHAAALCVAEQGANLFWRMHDQLFQNQDQWKNLPDPSLYLEEVAKGLGIDLSTYNDCITAGRAEPMIQKGISEAQSLGFNGTPSFQLVRASTASTYKLVGAYPLNTFSQLIETGLAGDFPTPTPVPTPEAPKLPFWASPEGLKPDPQRPGHTMAGDPYKGNPGARVVVIENADFQCPFCRQHQLENQPAIDAAYVDSGQVFWVYRNFPLAEHPQAAIAAAAAECASDQGKFWEIHDLLYQTVETWSVDAPDSALAALAETLGLDTKLFSECLNGRDAMQRVSIDLSESAQYLSQTPTFFFLVNGRPGFTVRGFLEKNKFDQAIQQALESSINP